MTDPGDGWEPTPLELLADAAGLDYWELRDYLEREVERRLEDVATPGDDSQTPPGHHQHSI